MMSALVALVAVFLLGQGGEERRAFGVVVDEEGKAIAGAKVAMFAPATSYFTGDPVEAKGLSDQEGNFGFRVPPTGRLWNNGVNVWAYRPGLALGAEPFGSRKPNRIVLRNFKPRSVKVEGANGEPIAGARVEPRQVFFSGGTASAELP